MRSAIRWAPKLPVAMIVQVYKSDAAGYQDERLVDDVGWRLLARCSDVLLVSDSKIVCPDCKTTFDVPWIGKSGDRASRCPGCGWELTAREYHASFEHRDMNGVGARSAFADYTEQFPRLQRYAEKMRAIDRLVHAVHTTGGLAARNLFEGRARDVLATLDALANRSAPL